MFKNAFGSEYSFHSSVALERPGADPPKARAAVVFPEPPKANLAVAKVPGRFAQDEPSYCSVAF